jgi:membrane protein
MAPRKFLSLLRQTIVAWSEDYVPSMGAALAYYTLFSIAPLLLIVITIAGWVFGAEAARGEIVGQLRALMGDDGARAIEGLLTSVNKPVATAFSTVFGVGLLAFGATTVFAELQNDLDRIWKTPVRVRRAGIWNLLRSRILSFGMMLGIAFLLLVSLVVSAGIAALARWYAPYFGSYELLLHGIDFAVSLGMISCLFALIYKVMPRVHIGWRDVWVGSAFTAFLFVVGKELIGLYLGKSGIASGFGAAASLVVMLIWVYYSAQIFLLGAEFTHTYWASMGSGRPAVSEGEAGIIAPGPEEDRRSGVLTRRSAR